jgi:hypothetical protein
MNWETLNNVTGKTSNRIGDASLTFGVELEISRAPRYNLLDGVTPFGCKSDCSVNGDGREFVSPILSGDEGLEAVESLLAFAKSNSWVADESCGFHLHLGMQDTTEEVQRNVYLAYKLTERVWRNLASPRRAENEYCKVIPHNARRIRESSGGLQPLVRTRYEWVNISALFCHGTLEIRLHEGTIDTERVINWIIAHVRFVSAIKKMTEREITRKFADVSIARRFVRLERLWDVPALGQFYRKIANGRIAGLRGVPTSVAEVI